MSSKPELITLKTVGQFLLFNREAILKIAGSSQSCWLGLLFVVLAALAREYDGEYLVAQPGHLFLPLAASILGCIALFVLLRIMSWRRGIRSIGLLKHFFAILNLYWMTAPLALLYAIPVERWTDPGSATRINLWLLAIVSVWRVALMIRAICVLHNAGVFAAMCTVMLFVLGAGWTALRLIPSPVFMIMGGIRLTESEDIILGTRFFLIFAGVVTSPVWFIGYLVCAQKGNRTNLQMAAKSDWRWQLAEQSLTNLRVSRSSWIFAVLALLSWIPLLMRTQPEQRLRWEAEQLLLSGRYAELSQLTLEHPAGEFPPHWDAPPRIGYGENEPDLGNTLLQLKQHQPAPWFWQMYLDKLKRRQPDFEYTLQNVGDQDLSVVIALFSELKESASRPDRIRHEITRQLTDSTISEKRADLLRQLQELLPSQ